jgi:hypothetical protein
MPVQMPMEPEARDSSVHLSVRRTWPVLLLLVGLGLLFTWFHGLIVNFGDHEADRAERHALVLSGQGEAPWTYRVAMPMLAEGVGRVASAVGVPQDRAVEAGYLFWRGVATVGVLLLFFRLLQSWVEPPWALAGTLLLAALHVPSYAYYWFQPDSPLDLLLWVAAATVTIEKREGWLYPMILLGGLNRETSIFVVAIHLALGWRRNAAGSGGWWEGNRRLILRCFVLVALWAAAIGAVRLVVGPVRWAHGATASGLFLANVTHIDWILYAALFLGVLWVVPFAGWKLFPPELKRLAWALLPYLVLQVIFGRIREVRLFLPLTVVLVPMAMILVRDRLSHPEPAT